MKIKNKGSLKAGSLKGGSRMKEWYQMNEEEVLKMLDADKNGLSSERAEELLKMTSNPAMHSRLCRTKPEGGKFAEQKNKQRPGAKAQAMKGYEYL